MWWFSLTMKKTFTTFCTSSNPKPLPSFMHTIVHAAFATHQGLYWSCLTNLTPRSYETSKIKGPVPKGFIMLPNYFFSMGHPIFIGTQHSQVLNEHEPQWPPTNQNVDDALLMFLQVGWKFLYPLPIPCFEMYLTFIWRILNNLSDLGMMYGGMDEMGVGAHQKNSSQEFCDAPKNMNHNRMMATKNYWKYLKFVVAFA